METTVRLTDDLAFGPQPDEAGLRGLSEQGFRGVINVRHDEEDAVPMTSAEEGKLVRKLGMDYAAVPVPPKACRPHTIERFLGELDRMAKPIYVHCEQGGNAGGLAVMDLAIRQRMSGEQALARARELGVNLGDDKLAESIKSYVDSRRGVDGH